MKAQRIYTIVFFVVALAGVAGFVFFRPNAATAPERPTISITISGEEYTALLARTTAEKNKGLGGVEDLSPYVGMVFVLKNEEGGAMWMKGMLIPLDMLWLSEEGVVLKLEEGIAASDQRIFPHPPTARYVLEVDAGFAAQHGIKAGNVVGIQMGRD